MLSWGLGRVESVETQMFTVQGLACGSVGNMGLFLRSILLVGVLLPCVRKKDLRIMLVV